MECLLDDVVIGKQEMVGAIDAVCDVAQRIISKLKEGAVGGRASLTRRCSRQWRWRVSSNVGHEALCRQPRPAEGHQATSRLQDVDIDLPRVSQATRTHESQG